jgi:dihydrofolate reductase
MTKAFPEIAMIAALAGPKRTIGNGGKLVAMISDDLKRFKALTTGHAIIMGRKTYQSIGRALPNRENFVITRDANFNAPGIIVCANLDEALDRASKWETGNSAEKKQIFIIGGGEIYNQALTRTDRLYLTLIDKDVPGDTFFPDYSAFRRITHKEDRVNEKTELKYSWVDLER